MVGRHLSPALSTNVALRLDHEISFCRQRQKRSFAYSDELRPEPEQIIFPGTKNRKGPPQWRQAFPRIGLALVGQSVLTNLSNPPRLNAELRINPHRMHPCTCLVGFSFAPFGRQQAESMRERVLLGAPVSSILVQTRTFLDRDSWHSRR